MSVTLHTTHGDLKFELYCQTAPLACRNFLALCAAGHYDQSRFTRNVAGFMIQGGGSASGKNVPTSIYEQTYFPDEVSSTLKFESRGLLAMASRQSQPNSNASQFFITYGPAPHLNQINTIFGRLLPRAAEHAASKDDDETLACLERLPADAKHKPMQHIAITSVTIHANQFAEAGDADHPSLPLRAAAQDVG